MGEMTAVEPVAIALYESYVRSSTRRKLSWLELSADERRSWRRSAQNMIIESQAQEDAHWKSILKG